MHIHYLIFLINTTIVLTIHYSSKIRMKSTTCGWLRELWYHNTARSKNNNYS